MRPEFFWLAVALVSIVSTARITRLLTYDVFPPVKAVRERYLEKTGTSDWSMLVLCPYCMSFWVGLVVVLSGWASDWHTAWWLVNGVFAASYVGAMVMVFDGDDDDDETGGDA